MTASKPVISAKSSESAGFNPSDTIQTPACETLIPVNSWLYEKACVPDHNLHTSVLGFKASLLEKLG